EYVSAEEPTGVELCTVWDGPPQRRDEGVDLEPDSERFKGFWQSTARDGFILSVNYVVAFGSHRLTIRITKCRV
ncbi:hypothetical protein AAVH_27926, partial [Aphelenchoides avenae]